MIPEANVRKNNKLAWAVSATMVAAAFISTSAFAESRHTNETRIHRDNRSSARSTQRSEGRWRNESRNDGRSYDRGTTRNADRNTTRNYDRNNDRNTTRNYDRNYRNDNRGSYYRNDNRNRSYGRTPGSSWGYTGRYSNRQPYYTHGRVSRISPYRGGYHVWIGGAPYPFFIPLSYWNRSRFRIGVSIGLGGYYNPLGYYDYYDGYRDGYYDSYRYNPGYRGNSRADFEGTVESIDPRRDSFVVRNDETGDYITVVLRDRREGFPRVGDFVAVRGDWTRSGYFRAYDVDFLDN